MQDFHSIKFLYNYENRRINIIYTHLQNSNFEIEQIDRGVCLIYVFASVRPPRRPIIRCVTQLLSKI